MSDYRNMYFQLAAKVAEAVELLTSALQKGETEYMKALDQTELLTLLRGEKSIAADGKKKEHTGAQHR